MKIKPFLFSSQTYDEVCNIGSNGRDDSLNLKEQRWIDQNPTYLLKFAKNEQVSSEKLMMIANDIQKICQESIWSNPGLKMSTEPVFIEQINHFVNLKLKLKFNDLQTHLRNENVDIVTVSRVFMKPLVKADMISSPGFYTQPKYGKDKEVQSAFFFI